MAGEIVRVTYLELGREPAAPPPAPPGVAVARERPGPEAYLTLYRAVGGPLRWDSREKLGAAALAALLASDALAIHVLRDGEGAALGFCEFDRRAFPTLELTHFGLVPAAQGRRRGPWLLAHALACEWREGARRIWLHTDTWDHPAALAVYARAGFVVTAVREEPVDGL